MSAFDLESRLPPDTIWSNGKLEQRPRTRSIYDDFTEIETLLNTAWITANDLAREEIAAVKGKVLALKERVCALKPEQRTAPKNYRVLVIFQATNTEVRWFTVTARDLGDAEKQAVAKASFEYRANPAELVARHVHELCAACGQVVKGDDREA